MKLINHTIYLSKTRLKPGFYLEKDQLVIQRCYASLPPAIIVWQNHSEFCRWTENATVRIWIYVNQSVPYTVLRLKKHDTIIVIFPELFIIEKHVKIRFKNRGSSCYILSVLEVKTSKALQKFNKRDCFCLHSWFHFLWRFLSKK